MIVQRKALPKYWINIAVMFCMLYLQAATTAYGCCSVDKQYVMIINYSDQ